MLHFYNDVRNGVKEKRHRYKEEFRLEILNSAHDLFIDVGYEKFSGWREAGAHQIAFDGSGLPSGIYFAKLTAGDYSQVQKLVLMK